MKKLEQTVKKYIDLVLKKIYCTQDYEDFFYLIKEFNGLEEIIKYNDLNIKIPKKAYSVIEHKSDYSWDFYSSFYDGFEDVYDSVREINRKMGYTFNKLNLDYDFSMMDLAYEIDVDDSIKLVKKFFDYFDKDIGKHFNNMLSSGNFFICNMVDGHVMDGFTLTLNSQRVNIIEVGFRDDILLSSNIIHETLHSFIESQMFDLKYDERKKKLWNDLDEVITYFSQLAFIKFLEEIDFDLESIEFLKSDNLVRWICFSNRINYYNEYTASDIIDKGFCDFLLDDSVTYGTTLAYHYYDKYLKDGNISDIFNMSLDSPFNDKISLLSDYGIDSSKLGDYEFNKQLLLKYGSGFTKKK